MLRGRFLEEVRGAFMGSYRDKALPDLPLLLNGRTLTTTLMFPPPAGGIFAFPVAFFKYTQKV